MTCCRAPTARPARRTSRGASFDAALPVKRAHGVPRLIAYLEGRLSLGEAVERSKLDTRHYARRQFTWARHQLQGFEWVAPEAAVAAGARALERTADLSGAAEQR